MVLVFARFSSPPFDDVVVFQVFARQAPRRHCLLAIWNCDDNIEHFNCDWRDAENEKAR